MTDGFQEDLAENLRLAETLAPVHCLDCGGYHLDRARRRHAAGSLEPLDQKLLVGAIHDILAKRIRSRKDAISFAIAGCGDTNLLSLCCVAAEKISSGVARLIDFTAIDRCLTPLRQCEVFADRNKLKLVARRADLAIREMEIETDLLIVHSLLRFMPQIDHPPVMAAFRRWLKPDGAVVFSHRLADPESAQGYYRSSYDSAEQLMALFRQAGFEVRDFRVLEDGAARRRVFCLLS
jgi:hypothetical protein